MAETLKLEINRPVELSFRFVTGRDCTSSYNGESQKMFTVQLATGELKTLYLSVSAGQRVEQLLAQQDIRSGEFVDLCKAQGRDGNQRGIQYQIKRVNPKQEAANVQPSTAPQQAPAVSQPPQPIVNGNGNSHEPPANGNGHSNGTNPQALWAARVKAVTQAKIDIYVELCAWAAEIYNGNVSASEVQAFLMNTLISADKNGGTR
jgi:hypothetical protein